MNRTLVLLIVLLLVVVAAVGVTLFMRARAPSPAPGQTPPVTFPPDNTPTTVPQSPQSKADVQSTFSREIAPYNNDNAKLYDTVLAGGYALQTWVGDSTGGEALLKYDPNVRQWFVIAGGGGAWSVEGLVEQGVPRDVAVALIAGMSR